jgi:sodium/bile acid cotransporter 7
MIRLRWFFLITAINFMRWDLLTCADVDKVGTFAVSSHKLGRHHNRKEAFKIMTSHPRQDIGLPAVKTSKAGRMQVKIPAVNRWFLLGEILAIVTAYFYPRLGSSGGLLRTDIFVSKIGVFLLFFLKGLSVSPATVRDACAHYKVNILTQVFSSIFIPLFTWGIVGPFVTDTGFRDGLICLAALPCALNTAVSLAAAAGAKTSTVFFNGILGRLLGVILTPAIVTIMMESGGTVEGVTWGSQESMSIGQLLTALRTIAVYVFLPMTAAQLVRRIPNLPDRVLKYSEQESLIDEIIL